MKNLSLFLAVCLMLSMLSACANQANSTTASTTAESDPSQVSATPTEIPTASAAYSSVSDFSLDPPEGFTASVELESFTFLISPNAPEDTSSITVEVMPRDEAALQRTEAEFETLITGGAMPEQTGTPDAPNGAKEYSLVTMQQSDVDGWPALVCEYNLAFTGFSSHILRYEAVTPNANYVFTFTDNTEDLAWTDAFVHSAGTIHLISDEDSLIPNYSGLTRYSLGSGLSIYATDGLQPQKADGFTACIGDSNVLILLMADNKQANNLTQLDTLGYAEVLRQSNELDEFQTNSYGDLYTHFYTTDDTGAEYYNMIFLKETDEDFLVLQLTCSKEVQSLYARQFPLWASSLM